MYCLLAQVGGVCSLLEGQVGPGLGSKCQGLDDPVHKTSYTWGTDQTNVSQMMREEREDQGNGERGDEPCDLNCNCGMNIVALTATSVDKEPRMYVCTHACTVCTSLCTCLEGSIHMHKFPNYIQWKGLVAIMSLCVCVSCSAMSNSLQPHGL